MPPISRRAVILGLSTALTGSAALAQRPQGFASVRADVGPLLAKGLGGYAEEVRGALDGALSEAFKDRLTPGGPRLVVRITGLSMPAYVGGENRFGMGGGVPSDYLEGEALVVGRRGEILSRLPQLSALPSSSGGAWYDPAAESRRLVAVAQHYAGWLRRRL